MRQNIGEYLIQTGLISNDDLENALGEHKRTGERLGVVLVRMNLATEKQIAAALAVQLGFPYVSLVENPPSPSAVILIPKEVALKRVCIAVSLEKNLLTVAMSDPLLFSLVQDLESQTGFRINQVVSTRGDILEAIQTGYPDKTFAQMAPQSPNPVFEPVASLKQTRETIMELVDLVVKGALESKASDVHVEPTGKDVLVRHRLDGLLTQVMALPREVHEELIARLKVVAGMDVAEKRLPQEGRLRSTSQDGREIDFRVSTLRTLYGEKVVMRVLGHPRSVPTLDEIGLSAVSLREVRRFLGRQHGMILVVGPTGSGKSTTLGSALNAVKSEKTSIITIEDPIEYQIPGVNQTQIDEKINLTFASALRSVLQQDPDLILVGEIRDAETAKIAMQAAQAGHLVLSTLQTDDAPSVVTRLMDLGTAPDVIAGGLVGVVAQRLLRRLCVHCRRQAAPAPSMLRALNMADADTATIQIYQAVGCDQCNHTGYRGRIGIFEVMRVTDKIRRLISGRAAESQIRETALTSGMVSLGEDGLAKVKSGMTTPEELVRVVDEVREMRPVCTGCGSVVGVDFNACPSCGKRLGGACPHCGRALQTNWSFCPYCARSAAPGTDATRPRRLRDREGRERPRERPAAKITEFKK